MCTSYICPSTVRNTNNIIHMELFMLLCRLHKYIIPIYISLYFFCEISQQASKKKFYAFELDISFVLPVWVSNVQRADEVLRACAVLTLLSPWQYLRPWEKLLPYLSLKGMTKPSFGLKVSVASTLNVFNDLPIWWLCENQSL